MVFITDPIRLRKIVQHYEKRLKEVNQGGKDDPKIYAASGKTFVDKTLTTIPTLIEAIGQVNRTIEIFHVSHPEQKVVACLALDQYIKDLKEDKITLESKLSFKMIHLQEIENEIGKVTSLRQECECDSQG